MYNMLCTSLHSFVQCCEVFVLFYLGARENIFNTAIHCKYVENYILSRHVTIFLFDQKMFKHFWIFAFTCIYFRPCLFENYWDVDKDKTDMKMECKLFYRGLWYQRRIQNLVKHLRCSILRKWLTAKSR